MKVEHDAVGHRFFVRLPAGQGQLLYKVAGPGRLNFWHTEVWPSLRAVILGHHFHPSIASTVRAQ